MAKDTEKLIRQLSLISYLMAERRPVTATEIRRDVEGYSDMTEDAFARRFYADRAELDALGIHLRVDKPADGFSEQENYSLAPEAFHLPAIAFSDDERAALQTALTLLDGEFAYAEPLRLALQQITWGRPSPLGTDSRQTIGLGITASAGGSELSGRLAKVDTAIYRRKRIEFEYYTMQSGETALRKVDPYHLLFEGGQWYLVGHSHERGAVRVFRLSRIRGKVAYSTKAEHDFQRPADFDPRGYASRIPWQLGDAVGTGEVWVSDKIAWYVERQFGAYGEMRDAEDGGRIFRTGYAIPRLLVAWALRFGDQARVCDPPELVEESRARLDAIIERHRGEAFTSVADGTPPRGRRARGRGRRAHARRRGRHPARALRAAGDARHRADRRRPRGPPDPGRRGPRAAADLRAGAARGHLRAQRRQLRRRRLRDLRRGAADGRDRGRPRALLGHLRPPGPAAADRGQRARGGDRPDRRPLRAGRARLRAREDRRRARPRPRRGGPARHLAHRRGRDHAARRDRRARVAPAARSNTGPPTRTRSRTASSSPTRSSTARRRGTSRAVDPGKDDDLRQFRLDRIKSAELLEEPSSAARTSTRWPTSAAGRAPAWSRARAPRTSGSRPSRRAGRSEERTVLAELPDGAVIVEWAYKGTAYLVREVLKEAGDAAVLEPADAREAVLAAAEGLLAPSVK